jgi:predicted dehydrogenase
VSQVSPGRKNGLSVEVAGARATLDWQQEEPERLWIRTRAEARLLTRGSADGEPPGAAGVPSLPAGHPEGWAEALRDLLRPFYRAVAAGGPPAPRETGPYPTLADGAHGVAFVEAVLASARDGRWTRLEDGHER